MGPFRAHGPAEADGLPEAHGPPKILGPRDYSPPLPPLSAAMNSYKNNYLLVIYCLKQFFCKHECEKKLCLTNQKPHSTSLASFTAWTKPLALSV